MVVVFFFFFFFSLQWVRSATNECLAKILFLWWLGAYVVAGSFLLVKVVVVMVVL